MFTAREQRLIVTMLAAGSPVWYVAAVTKKDRHSVYVVGARHGYPHRGALKRALKELTVEVDVMADTGQRRNRSSRPADHDASSGQRQTKAMCR